MPASTRFTTRFLRFHCLACATPNLASCRLSGRGGIFPPSTNFPNFILLTRAFLQCQTSKICRSETMAYPVYFRSQTSKFCCSACKICCSDQQLLRSIHGKVVMNTGTSWNRCIPKTFLMIREIPTVALGFRFGLGLVLWFAGGSYSFLLCSVLPCARAKAGAPLIFVEEVLRQP